MGLQTMYRQRKSQACLLFPKAIPNLNPRRLGTSNAAAQGLFGLS